MHNGCVVRGQRVSAVSNDAGTWDLLALNHRANRLMDTDWTENLTPDEARAALDALNANKVTITAREAVELLKLKRALEVKADEW